MRQNFQRISAGRRHRPMAFGSGDNVNRRIFGKSAVAKHAFKMPALIPGKEKIVMSQLRD